MANLVSDRWAGRNSLIERIKCRKAAFDVSTLVPQQPDIFRMQTNTQTYACTNLANSVTQINMKQDTSSENVYSISGEHAACF